MKRYKILKKIYIKIKNEKDKINFFHIEKYIEKDKIKYLAMVISLLSISSSEKFDLLMILKRVKKKNKLLKGILNEIEKIHAYEYSQDFFEKISEFLLSNFIEEMYQRRNEYLKFVRLMNAYSLFNLQTNLQSPLSLSTAYANNLIKKIGNVNLIEGRIDKISYLISDLKPYEFGFYMDQIDTSNIVLKFSSNAVVDENYFKTLLIQSLSLSYKEKLDIINRLEGLSQFQIDELIRIFEEEISKFKELPSNKLHDIEQIEKKSFEDWQKGTLKFSSSSITPYVCEERTSQRSILKRDILGINIDNEFQIKHQIESAEKKVQNSKIIKIESTPVLKNERKKKLKQIKKEIIEYGKKN